MFQHILLFSNVCKQTFHISHVRISQKVKGVLMWNIFNILFSYNDEDIGRFSNQHYCNFNIKTEIWRRSSKIFLDFAKVQVFVCLILLLFSLRLNWAQNLKILFLKTRHSILLHNKQTKKILTATTPATTTVVFWLTFVGCITVGCWALAVYDMGCVVWASSK